jgi:membrane protease YdiL (CAAX protease family)
MLPRMLGLGLVPAMLAVGFLHGVWHLPLLLTTDYYHATGNPWIVAPLFLITLTLAGVFYGFLRIWTGSVWPVAIANSAVNIAWALSSEVSATQSPAVLEYIGGESGLVMICGLLIIDLILIRVMARSRLSPTFVEKP